MNLCFSCSSMGSHQQEMILLELIQRGSFSWAAGLHKPLQCGSSVRPQVLPPSLLCHRNLTGSYPPSGTHLNLVWDSFKCDSAFSSGVPARPVQQHRNNSSTVLPAQVHHQWLLSKRSQAQISKMISSTLLQQAAMAKSSH